MCDDGGIEDWLVEWCGVFWLEPQGLGVFRKLIRCVIMVNGKGNSVALIQRWSEGDTHFLSTCENIRLSIVWQKNNVSIVVLQRNVQFLN